MTTPQPNGFQMRLELMLRSGNIDKIRLCAPDWSQDKIDHSGGIVRYIDEVVALKNNFAQYTGYGFNDLNQNLVIINEQHGEFAPAKVRMRDESSRRSYEEHMKNCMPDASKYSAIIVDGIGNLLSNRGVVGYDAITQRILRVRGEEVRMNKGWEYPCLYFSSGHAGIKNFSFSATKPQGPAVDFLVSGQPLVWDGEVINPTESSDWPYDGRHLYRMRATAGDSAEERCVARQNIQRYGKVWLDVFAHEKQGATASAMKKGLRDHLWNLPIEDNYLHSAIGVDRDANVYVLQMHGSMQELGVHIQKMGAYRAILVENGEDTGTYYRSPKRCPEGDLLNRPHGLRDNRMCMLAFGLKNDDWGNA